MNIGLPVPVAYFASDEVCEMYTFEFEIMARVPDDLDFDPQEYSHSCGNTASV
jgi:hypothetical protein